MTKYLTALKGQYFRDPTPEALPKLPKGASDSFGSDQVATSPKYSAPSTDHATRHWRIRYPGDRVTEVILSDEITRPEVLALRPGAIDAEPIPPAHRPATTAEAAELRMLVHAVLSDPADREEALRAGLGDIEAALTCFRALAAAAGSSVVEPTDMRSCRQCAALTADGHCRQAAKGVPLGFPVARKYQPTLPDRPQRCAGYLPPPDDPDQRTGAQRWSWMLRGSSEGAP